MWDKTWGKVSEKDSQIWGKRMLRGSNDRPGTCVQGKTLKGFNTHTGKCPSIC